MALTKSYKNEYDYSLHNVGESGFVESVQPPLVYVDGLPGARVDEVVYLETGEMGIVRALGENKVEVLLFSKYPASTGCQVARSGQILRTPVGTGFLGQSIDPLGNSIYPTIPTPQAEDSRVVDDKALGISSRTRVTESFVTGVTVVDLMTPLGRGQRELVIGDRKTGRTEFLLQTLLTQHQLGSVCIYANIGKKKADIKKVENFIRANNLQDSTLVISSSSTDSLGHIYITPYTAMTFAEYFRDMGRHVVLILDDLSTHAKFYREMSLLGRRFPGRNSYPGDIFYTHARLLERAGNYKTNTAPASITCLPVADTVESDISGYIQTNLMSITDGHIYFDKDIFEKGRRPAVNYFLSVTRVGRQTQSPLQIGITRELTSFLTLLEKTQRYIHFGAEVNEGIKSTLATGDRVNHLLNQSMGVIVPINLQLFLFAAIWAGLLNSVQVDTLGHTIDNITQKYNADESFRSTIDTLISETPDFNVLLGKVSSQSKQILDQIKVT